MHRLVALGALAWAMAGPTFGADYPSRRITILVGFTPGGIHEISSRLFAERLRSRLGQPVVVELKPGASGEIALAELLRAAPDGYTITPTTSALAAMPLLSSTFKSDVVDDFSHLGILAQTPFLLASSGAMPFSDLKGMLAYAKANPGKLSFGSPTASVDLDFALLWQKTGISVVSVPYKGAAPAMAALLSNEIQLTATSHRAVSAYLDSGKVRALGFAANRRFTLVPDVPAIAEAVPGYAATTIWLGFSGPKGLPKDVVATLNAEMLGMLKDPGVQSTIVDKFAYEVVGSTPERMAIEMRAANERYIEAAKVTNFKRP